MIDYEIYKILHLTFIMLLFSAFAVQTWSTGRNKKLAIFSGITSFLIFVAGMGLMARLGIGHTEPWPTWILLKVVIWLVIVVGTPIIIKRAPKFAPKWFYVICGLFVFAATNAIYK